MTSPTHAGTGFLPLAFPEQVPSSYLPLEGEPLFEPGRHLALEMPGEVTSLEELGYGREAIARCPSNFGYSKAFRILSDEGVAVMREICGRIYHNRNDSQGTGAARLGSYARGAGYRSRFIRDFCDSVELAEHLGAIAGVPLMRHSVPAVACGINYAPEDINRAVDSWHVDSVAFDVVLMVSDPGQLRGGEFQVFHGTREEGRALMGIEGEEGRDVDLAPERVKTIPFPAAGYGFLQQGNMIFHRACRLREAGERITMIPAFEVLPLDADDATNAVNMLGWTDPGMAAELTRREVWRASARLEKLLHEISLDDSRPVLARRIEEALAPLETLHKSLMDPEI